jgi:hypothetical protein
VVAVSLVQVLTLSSRGLGHHPFTVSTGVRIPVGSPSCLHLVACKARREKHLPGVVVQLVRIPACHAGGRGFEPRPLRHQRKSRCFDNGFFLGSARLSVRSTAWIHDQKCSTVCLGKAWVEQKMGVVQALPLGCFVQKLVTFPGLIGLCLTRLTCGNKTDL